MSEEEKTKKVPRLGGPVETITLLDMADTLFELREVMQGMVEEGIVEPLNPKTVDTDGVVVQPPYPGKLWFGVKITNDGANSVWVTVNTEKSPTTPQEIKPEETWGVQFKTAVIEDIRLYTESGTSTVRIRGER